MAEFNYAKHKQKKNIRDITEMLKEMPIFVEQYFKANSMALSPSSQHSYLYDIYNFLKWWHSSIPELSEKKIEEMTVDAMANVSSNDIIDYIAYMKSTSDTLLSDATLARRCAALNSLFEYLEQHSFIDANPMNKVKRPKIKKDKRIIKLEDFEVENFLDSVLFGKGFSEHQRKYLENTRKRDYTIVMLLLTTGIRISEMVGLNIDDVSFNNFRIQITRKGGKRQYIPVSDEMLSFLAEYIKERKKICPADDKDATALFLSTQHTRLTTCAVENMIKKYAKAAGIDKPITPHKLRKTYGTNLYNKTRDIYLVANALGHDSVATTTKHYVASDEEDLMKVRNLMQTKQNKKGDNKDDETY